MSQQPALDGPSFHVEQEAEPAAETLIAGFSTFGLAGLTAVDYIVDHLDLEERGHVTVDQLPTITPFENGTPRHHTRLFSRDGLDVTVLVGDLFIPPFAAEAFSTALLEWTEANDVSEVTVLSGIPIPHGPDGHRVFYVASEDYQERRLSEAELPPMTEGFLDGVNASLMQRGMESDLATGILTTPVHSQGPDIEAALRLIEGVRTVYDLDIDTEPLETFAAEVKNYYEGLSQHLEAAEPQDRHDIMFG
ncbi:proteasome assembly chaperone family protein [Halococcus sp. AFM35]|uniref:proteasome assembly chaperone family protein n=1 Tax=Halococcus sp. AFM35 TaxID=3421653 RepID=UPI003EBD2CD0